MIHSLAPYVVPALIGFGTWAFLAFCAWCLVRAGALESERIKNIQAFGGDVRKVRQFRASDALKTAIRRDGAA